MLKCMPFVLNRVSNLIKFFTKWLQRLLFATIGILCIGFLGIVLLILNIERTLPDVSVLKDIQLQVPLRIYSNEGLLIAEYGEKKRSPVPYDEIPRSLINAVLATEDQRYFEHSGVDFLGLVRASVVLITTGTKAQGGSTITMQVARNFFLNSKKTYSRKLREILLAVKIDKSFSKQKILDLYLNKIFYGNRAYGVEAAAEVYYGKRLGQLSLAQTAMIAGIPKAPSSLNPLANRAAALDRRNHVLARMLDHGYITQTEYQTAIAEPETARYHGPLIECPSPYVGEMIRSGIISQFGEDAYTSGMQIYTTIQCKLQQQAQTALQTELLSYDKRHGYRGPRMHLRYDNPEHSVWIATLQKQATYSPLVPAVVFAVAPDYAEVLTADNRIIRLDWAGLSWARPATPDNSGVGPSPQSAGDVVRAGDIVDILPDENNTWRLAQVPEVQGAFIALSPQNGAVSALVGGFNYAQSNFNRVSQAALQPGSSFKPFIYTAALDKGFTLASVINDAPFVINDPSLPDGVWRPQNDERKFFGPTRLRVALTHSRNLVSIRLLNNIGISYATKYLEHFGFNSKDIPHSLSLALGTASVSPLQMARGYAIIANGGFDVRPYLINRILDINNNPLYTAHPLTVCVSCVEAREEQLSLVANANALTDKPVAAPALPPLMTPDHNPVAIRTISPQTDFLITSVLKDVIQMGTGSAAKVLNRDDIAGKTGTTQKQRDGWFNGFNPHLVAVVWVGFDEPKSLGEYGAKVALPIWIDFMRVALDGDVTTPTPPPPGIVSVRIDRNSGFPSSGPNTLFEYFKTGTVPTAPAVQNDNGTDSGSGAATKTDEDTQLF